jgi:hypothetical protein
MAGVGEIIKTIWYLKYQCVVSLKHATDSLEAVVLLCEEGTDWMQEHSKLGYALDQSHLQNKGAIWNNVPS